MDEVRGRKEGRRAAGWGDAHLNGRHSRLRSVAASSVASREVTGPHLRDAELTASTAISRSCERSNFSADLFRDPSSLPANFIPPRAKHRDLIRFPLDSRERSVSSKFLEGEGVLEAVFPRS